MIETSPHFAQKNMNELGIQTFLAICDSQLSQHYNQNGFAFNCKRIGFRLIFFFILNLYSMMQQYINIYYFINI